MSRMVSVRGVCMSASDELPVNSDFVLRVLSLVESVWSNVESGAMSSAADYCVGRRSLPVSCAASTCVLGSSDEVLPVLVDSPVYEGWTCVVGSPADE